MADGATRLQRRARSGAAESEHAGPDRLSPARQHQRRFGNAVAANGSGTALARPSSRVQHKSCGPSCAGTCPTCSNQVELEQPSGGQQAKTASEARSDPAERQADEIGDRIGADLVGVPIGEGPLSPRAQEVGEAHLGTSLAGTRLIGGSAGHERASQERALAVTEGSEIHFRGDHLTSGSAAGRALIGHEMTHVAQQRRSGTSTKQHSLFDDIVQGAEQLGNEIAEAAESAGESVNEAIDWAGEQVEAAEDWAHENLRMEISLPEIEVLPEFEASTSWSMSTNNKSFYWTTIDVPYIGPVFVTVYGRATLKGLLRASLGPGVARDLTLVLDPLAGVYMGSGTFTLPAELSASLTGLGQVGVDANWGCLVDVIRIEGGLGVFGTGRSSSQITGSVEVRYEDGEFSFDPSYSAELCVGLPLSLGAGVSILLFDYPLWDGRWELAGWAWEKCWSTSSDSDNPGGGASGGGGASESWAGEDGAFVGMVRDAAPRVDQPSVVPDLLQAAPPMVTMGFMPMDPAGERGQENPCPVEFDDQDCCPLKVAMSRFRVDKKGHRYRAKTITVKDSRGKHTRNAKGDNCRTQRLADVLGDDPAAHGPCLAEWIVAGNAGNTNYGGQIGSDSVDDYADIAKEVIENGTEINARRYWGDAGQVVGVDIATKQVTTNARIDGVPDEAHVIPQENQPT